MNIIYIIFIVIILFSFITGIFVTIVEAKEKKKYNILLNSEEESNEDQNTFKVFDSNNNLIEESSTKIVVPEDININYIQDSMANEDSLSVEIIDENKEPTIRLDNIEILENTIRLNVVPEKNIEKNNKKNSVPHLVPYSVVDDDII